MRVLFLVTLLAHLGCGRHFRHGAHGTPKFSAFKQQLKRDVFQSDPFQSPEDELLPPPFFDEKETSSNVTLLAGQTALLHCTVRNVGNKSVTWLRHFYPIPQLLALNNLTNIKDQRIKAFHTPGTEEFVLRIMHTGINDTGFYECQVAGKTTVSLFRLIYLDVVEPHTEIIGGPDIYVDRGSTLNVTCAVSAGAQEPGFILWSKQDKIVQFDGGETSKRQHLLKDSRGRSFSRLIIRKIDLDHSGRYTCQPESSPSQSVYVHVLNGTVLAVAADEGEDQQQQQQLPATSLGQNPSSPTSKVAPSQEKLPSNSEVSLASSSSKAQRLMTTTTSITSWFGAPHSPWFSFGIQVSSSLMATHLSSLIRTRIGN